MPAQRPLARHSSMRTDPPFTSLTGSQTASAGVVSSFGMESRTVSPSPSSGHWPGQADSAVNGDHQTHTPSPVTVTLPAGVDMQAAMEILSALGMTPQRNAVAGLPDLSGGFNVPSGASNGGAAATRHRSVEASRNTFAYEVAPAPMGTQVHDSGHNGDTMLANGPSGQPDAQHPAIPDEVPIDPSLLADSELPATSRSVRDLAPHHTSDPDGEALLSSRRRLSSNSACATSAGASASHRTRTTSQLREFSSSSEEEGDEEAAVQIRRKKQRHDRDRQKSQGTKSRSRTKRGEDADSLGVAETRNLKRRRRSYSGSTRSSSSRDTSDALLRVKRARPLSTTRTSEAEDSDLDDDDSSESNSDESESGSESDNSGSAGDISDDEPDVDLDIDLPPELIAKMRRWVQQQTRRLFAKLLAKWEKKNKHKRKRKEPEVPLVLARAVRDEMCNLIGISNTEPKVGGARKKPRRDDTLLPAPLPAGAPRRLAPDKTPLFNPDWESRVDEGVNFEYIQAVVALIRDKGAKKHKLSSKMAKNEVLVLKAAHTYFRSLRTRYQAQIDEAAKAKYLKKLENDKRNARRIRKAATLEDGVEIFRRFFGRAATVGVEQLIHVAWLSSEDSTDGAASHSEWERMRSKGRAGSKALEVRVMAWRSRQLNTIYLVLAVFARFKLEVFGDLDEDADRDLVDEERERYFTRLRDAVSRWRSIYLNNTQMYDRFRGPPVNHRQFPRDDKQLHQVEGMTYKQCISRKWAKKSHENLQFYLSAPPCPSSYTIFDLDVPMELIPQDDRTWLQELETTDAEPDEMDVD
ncbi:hypothetical protein BV20DRAFT_1052495 [Pilatotrama ljubarskyi]|nr:hypothetical protein BV20DRAFT_1052495 [Pilatotrama ljubarskyi]